MTVTVGWKNVRTEERPKWRPDVPDGVGYDIAERGDDWVKVEILAGADKVRAMTHLRKSTIVERLTEPGELRAVRDTLRQLRDSDDEGDLYLVMLWDAGRSFRRDHHAFESLESMLLAVLTQVHGDEATAVQRRGEILAPEET